MTPNAPTPLLGRGSWPDVARITGVLRKDTVGGALLLAATVAALVWANSSWADGYFALRDVRIGPSAVNLDLTLGTWAADGLLAIFFFVVGLELKREFVAGDLADPRRAALPIAAAIGGMAVPAGLFVLINLGGGAGALQGWAIPMATDIAFALAVLAVIGTHLPLALRTFLLTLAVVDDLFAITVIAVFYTRDLGVGWLLLALIPLAAFTVLVRRSVRAWWLLVPLALAVWVLVHESGVHATVAGVLLGFAVPVWRHSADGTRSAGPGMAENLEHALRPLSAVVAVPVFAFFAAGVAIGGLSGLREAYADPIAVGIIVGLLAGKTIGILGVSYLMTRFTRASLSADLRWVDVLGAAALAGIGFTVSLLIGDLAYGVDGQRDEFVKVGVLTGSLLSALVAGLILGARNRTYRRLSANDRRDIGTLATTATEEHASPPPDTSEEADLSHR